MTMVVRPCHQGLGGFLHLALGLDVERGGGLVQHQDRGVGQEGAGDGHALALAARQLDAALADQGVVALGQAQDEVVGAGLLGGRDDLLVGGVGRP
jgi:hypothetical protein